MEYRFDLGSHTRKVTTESSVSQFWFNAGLNWTYGFNHEEGLACFRKVVEHDPGCAMGYWGIAYAAGPFYNMPWCDFSEQELIECTRLCHEYAGRALELIDRVTPEEAGIISALAARFQKGHPVSQAEFDSWDDAYADAMREVYGRFPGDQDIAALFAEAMMTRTPWQLWDVTTNEPAAGADTLECLEVLERAIAESRSRGESPHPAILHLHIHVLEMSNNPERALESADDLFGLCPEAGHMEHMPAHVYVLCGKYDKAKACSIPAIEADRKYLDHAGPMNFYTTARCHDLHMMMYACMFLGQFEPAFAAAREMCDNVTPQILSIENRSQMCATLEGYHSTAVHVLVRFGRWRQIVEMPLPRHPDLYCVSTTMHHYARTIAHAYLGEFAEAERERDSFMASLGRIPPRAQILQ